MIFGGGVFIVLFIVGFALAITEPDDRCGCRKDGDE